LKGEIRWRKIKMKLNKAVSLICALIIPCFIAGAVLAQETENKKKIEIKKESPANRAGLKEEELSGIKGISTGIGGGYFTPLGDMKKYLKETWAVKIYVQNNSLGDGVMGYGLDASYAYPPDKEVKGGMMYIMAIPYLTVNMSPWIFELQVKFGAGVTVLNSVIRGKQSPSGDLTGLAGISLLKVFKVHYIVGIEADCYYMIELKSQTAFASYFFLGYKF
jgi:hypothetical protein